MYMYVHVNSNICTYMWHIKRKKTYHVHKFLYGNTGTLSLCQELEYVCVSVYKCWLYLQYKCVINLSFISRIFNLGGFTKPTKVHSQWFPKKKQKKKQKKNKKKTPKNIYLVIWLLFLFLFLCFCLYSKPCQYLIRI